MAYIENDSSNDRCNGCGGRANACRYGCVRANESVMGWLTEADRWEMFRFDCDTGSRVAIIYDEKLQIYNCPSNDPDFGTVAYNNGVLAASTVNELKRKLKKLELQTSGRKSSSFSASWIRACSATAAIAAHRMITWTHASVRRTRL